MEAAEVEEDAPRRRKRDELKSIWFVVRSAWKLVPPIHRVALITAAVIVAITSGANVSLALLLGKLADSVGNSLPDFNNDLGWQAGRILLFMSLVYLGREILNVVRRIVVESSCTRINCSLQRRVIGHVLKFDLQELAGERTGALHGRVFRSVDGLIHFVRLMFLDCMPAILTGAFALISAITKQHLLGLAMLGVVPLSLWLTGKQLASQKGIRLKLMRDCEVIDGTVVEQLGGVEYIRVANTHELETQRLAQAMEARRRRELRHHTQMALFGCAKALKERAFHILVLALATWMAIHRYISVGDVLTFSVLYLNVMSPLNEVHRVLDQGHESSLRVADLLNILHTPVDPSFTKHAKTEEATQQTAGIQIESLRASYRTSDGTLRPAIHDISLNIDRGQVIGVAGPSGSGKSSWIKVLLRLLHHEGGRIYVDGKSLGSLDRAELAEMFGYVGQNPFVFSGTIAENIAYGCGKPSLDEVKRAATQANLHDDIEELLGGYHALITERGQNLSGGQRQRISIARALLKSTPFLIFDEATSALDSVSERFIHDALSAEQRERTIILIAHRLSTLQDCDRIFVFDHGRIVESGTYNDLRASGGVFSALVDSADHLPKPCLQHS